MYPILKFNFEAVGVLMSEMQVFLNTQDLYNLFDTVFVLFYSRTWRINGNGQFSTLVFLLKLELYRINILR